MRRLRVRVAVVSYRCTDSLVALLTQLRSENEDWEICVWDNHSETSDLIQELLGPSESVDWVYFCTENVGFAKAINYIAALPGTWDVLLTVNPDLRIVSSLQPLISACSQTDVAAVGGCARGSDSPDCTNAYEDVGPFGLALRSLRGRAHEIIRAQPFREHTRLANGWIEGSLLAFSRPAWLDVGPLDEGYFLYSEEQDWQRRARLRGWSIIQVSTAIFVHAPKGSVSGNRELEHLSDKMQEDSRRYYIRKCWGTRGLILYSTVLAMGKIAKGCMMKKSWRRA